MAITNTDITLGKGTLLFKLDDEPGQAGYFELGNCPEFKISMETEKLEHISSEEGIKKKDAEIVTQQKCKGSFTLDASKIENLRLFAMALQVNSATQTAGIAQTLDIIAALDKWIKTGKMNLSNVVVKNSAETVTYNLGTDYEINLVQGRLKALSLGAITDAQSLKVLCDYAQTIIKDVIGATKSSLKGFIQFYGNPAYGRIQDLEGYVSLTPNGDLAFIGDDFTKFNFDVEFISHDNYFPGLYKLSDRGGVS